MSKENLQENPLDLLPCPSADEFDNWLEKEGFLAQPALASKFRKIVEDWLPSYSGPQQEAWKKLVTLLRDYGRIAETEDSTCLYED